MLEPLQRRALRVLRVLPTPVREQLVRASSPKYTLGSVCRIEHDGRVLLVETEYRRGWGFPGGLLDRNELPAAGVAREVREEVGLRIELVAEPVVIIDPGGRLVDFLFRARLADGCVPEDAHAASVEITRVEWVPAAEAVPRVEGTSGRRIAKLRLFDSLPDGGVVYLDPSDR